MSDNIKVDNGEYVCTIYLRTGITSVSWGALDTFLFLKSYIESIESYIWRDYEHNCYVLKLVGTSLTNIMRARFEIINYFIKL